MVRREARKIQQITSSGFWFDDVVKTQEIKEEAIMTAFDKLRSCVGNWQGTNRLYYPDTSLPEATSSNLTVTQSDDKMDEVIYLTYTWSYQNEPQQGTLSLWEAEQEQVTATWTDSWHTTVEMELLGERGKRGDDPVVRGDVSLLGSYGAPPGPDWGWRIALETGNVPRDSFHLRMYNISPEGLEEIAVEAAYVRRASDVS